MNKIKQFIEKWIKIKVDIAPTGESEFEEWCKKYDFAFLGFKHGRKAWCPQFQTYFRGAYGVGNLEGESFLVYEEDLKDLKSLIDSKWISVEEILKEEELKDWKIKIINSGGGLCLHEKKEIWIDKNNYNIPFLLHEIAHAKIDKSNQHNVYWGDSYTKLVIKYLNQPLPQPPKNY